MINLKDYGFEQIGSCWILTEGIYFLIHSKRPMFGSITTKSWMVDVLELYVENKDGEKVLLGNIEGEESLKTILNLIKY